MSGTASRGREAERQAVDSPAAEARGSRRRGRWAALGIMAVVAAAAVAAWQAGAFSPAASSGAGQQEAPPATAAVARQDLSATTPVSATLGYSGSYTVRGQGGGTLTSLPSPGQVISQGQALYRTDNADPAVLLYGSVPDWRTLDEGVTGADVSQLNHDLVSLGDANGSEISALGWDYFSWETKAGVQKLQSALGISSPSGSLSQGLAVFEPTALRIATVPGSLGGPASGPVLTATSNQHVVTILLSTAQESEVAVGDAVTITLPNRTSTPGKISSVGAVASSSSSSSSSNSSSSSVSATIAVQVTLTDPQSAGTLDQAPVTVNITTATAKNALAVPVTALLAQSSGGYDVEVAGPRNTRRYVPVQVGPVFDDDNGLVQVTGNLTPGQRVVVAAS